MSSFLNKLWVFIQMTNLSDNYNFITIFGIVPSWVGLQIILQFTR